MMEIKFDSLTYVNEYHNSLHDLWRKALYNPQDDEGFRREIVREVTRLIDLKKDRNDERGECTLFLLEQQSDRLVAFASTVSRLTCEPSHRDINDRPFYQLYRAEERDRKLIPGHLKLRGLTGWVFISNKSLLMNDVRKFEKVPSSISQPGEFPPVWGHVVSEFPVFHDKPEWTTQYIATPIRRPDTNDPIGVIRYTCKPRSCKLVKDEDIYLSAAADVISCALQNRALLRTRDAKLRLDSVEKGGDSHKEIENFLDILREAFNAQIVSLYIFDPASKHLTMSFERGIKLSREEMADIWYDGQTKKGATWTIFETQRTIHTDNIKQFPCWKGLYQDRYYRFAPRWADIIFIPFLGGALVDGHGKSIGVLKIELPGFFTSLDTFTTEDKNFFGDEVLPMASRLIQRIPGSTKNEWNQ